MHAAGPNRFDRGSSATKLMCRWSLHLEVVGSDHNPTSSATATAFISVEERRESWQGTEISAPCTAEGLAAGTFLVWLVGPGHTSRDSELPFSHHR